MTEFSFLYPKVTVGSPLPATSSLRGEEWKSFKFHIHDFANQTACVESPEFTCNGHQWGLLVFPSGTSEAGEGQVSAFLRHCSEGRIMTRFDLKVIDKFGKPIAGGISTNNMKEFSAGLNHRWGLDDYISRSSILDESQNILDSNGTLTIAVSMEEEPTTAFVPQNPLLKMMKKMFNDETTADVCFEVSSVDEKEGEKEESKSSVSFHAHRWILEHCAPMLAAIVKSNDSGGVVSATVNDVKPDIFRHLLSYVYGSNVPEEELEADAKDIIDAADKYSIVNLKLEAEVAYVQSINISLDNAMDNLLYADSRNCALLKEAVMTFLADNHSEAAAHISFKDCPGHCMKDLLIAFGRNNTNDANGTIVDDELTTLGVSELRRKLDKMGLEVDGSREAMIESIKSHS